jgi:preprotein translocase subunit YajC
MGRLSGAAGWRVKVRVRVHIQAAKGPVKAPYGLGRGSNLKRRENLRGLNCYILRPSGPKGSGGPLSRNTMKFNIQDLMLFLPMIAIIYFTMFLPKKREQQALDKMLKELKKGDRVLTHSGMYGDVFSIKDDLITLKFHDGVLIDFNKTAISRAVTEKDGAKA